MAEMLASPALILGVVGGMAVIILFFGIARAISDPSRTVEKRLDLYTSGEGRRAEPDDAKGRKPRKKEVSPLAADIERRLAGRSFTETLARDLTRANLRFTVGEFLILNLTIVLILGLLGFLITREAFGFALGIIGLFIPRYFLRVKAGRRAKAFDDQLGDIIGLLANSLRSGYSLLQSMEQVSRELSPPASEEFDRVVREIGLGLSVQQAMSNLVRRVQSEDLDLIVTAVNVQHEVGGNLAEILDTIGHTIRERLRIKGEISILTAQGRMTGYVISFLPIGLGVLLFMMSPDYMGQLFATQCGWIMVTAGGISMAVGFLVIRKIVDIDV